MLHRCVEHLLLSSGNSEGAIFLTRIISAIDRFSIHYGASPLVLGFFRKRRQAAALQSPESFRGEKAVLIRVNSWLALL